MNSRLYVGFLALFTLYVTLSFYNLYNQDLCDVEFITSQCIKRPWNELFFERFSRGHPPLYFLLTKLWTSLFGHNRMVLYSFSIAIGAIGIPATYFLARELGLKKEAWLVSLLWCVHPTILYYARYVRPQIGVSVLCCLSLLVLLKTFKNPTARNQCLLVILGIIGSFWSPILIIFWLGVALASLSIKGLTRGYWIALGTIFVSHGVSLWLSMHYHNPKYPKFTWLHDLTFERILKVFSEILAPLSPSLAILTGILVGWALLSRKSDVWKFLLFSAFYSIGILFLISYLKQPLLHTRYLVFLFPTIPLLIVKGLRKATLPFCLIALLSSGYMIHHRAYGLSESLNKISERFDPENDSVLILPQPFKEAIPLYGHEMDRFSIGVNEKSWAPIIESKITNKKRLWFLTLRKKRTIQRQELEEAFPLFPFYHYKSGKVELTGYEVIDSVETMQKKKAI